MSQILTVVQQKGGVGKTTIAVHLAYTLKELFPEKTIAVADADPQGSATKWIRRLKGEQPLQAYPICEDGTGKKLKNELKAIEADLIVIDLPPAIEAVTLRAALYSDMMLVPVGASVLDIEAGQAAVDVCKEALELDDSKQFLIVPSKVRSRTSSGQELRSVVQQWGPVAEAAIGLRVDFADAAIRGQSIGMYKSGSAAHKEMKGLAEEVAERLNWEEE